MEFQTINRDTIHFPFDSLSFLLSSDSFFVIYFEEDINLENDIFIKNNLEVLEELFEVKNRNFCYLPDIYKGFKDRTLKAIKSNKYWDEVEYIVIEKFILEMDYQRFYDFFKKSFGILDEIKNGTLNHIGNFAAIPKPIDATAETFLFDLANQLSIVHRPDIKFSKVEREIEKSDEELKKELFVRKMNDLIQEMKGSGVLHILSDYIFEAVESHLDTQRISKITSLIITENGDIQLPEYVNKELTLSHLTKTIFIFFLQQEAPILITELEIHKHTLLKLYKIISYRNDLERMEKSIEELTKGNAEGVYTHISRVKNAVNKIFSKRIAPYYYITGTKNEPKQILLEKKYIENNLG
jgi:hypothetical protein